MKKLIPICIIVLLSVVCLSIYRKENKKEEFKANTIKENDNKFTIAAYVNGVYSDTMPTESKYFGYVECTDNSGNKLDTLGFVEWENNKWDVRITDITKASTCNVYFIDPPNHWLDAEEGTLLKAIKDNNKVENVRSIPGKQINKTDEALLSGTYDDYGTSYFFRGNVQNNYVQFANKCWKIVRITGDGSIKLVLYNNDGVDCSANNQTDSVLLTQFMSDDETYIDTKGETQKVNKTNSGVGFMYGDAAATNFLDAQANLHDSTALKKLKQWYDLEETFPSNTKDKLADVIWCGDKSLSENNGYGNSQSFYGPYNRLTNYTVSLVCPVSDSINGNIGKISKYTAYDTITGNGALNEYKIGLLTADEVAFAGGVAWQRNNNYYLYVHNYWWTMSPYNFRAARNLAVVWYIDLNGSLASTDTVLSNASIYLRPSIALNYNVQATYNTSSEYAPGTVNNPYIVN